MNAKTDWQCEKLVAKGEIREGSESISNTKHE